MKIPGIHLRAFVEYARMHGMELPQVDDTRKMPVGEFYAVIKKISDFLDDELLGVRVGYHLRLHTLRVIYDISMKTGSLDEALYYCHDYLHRTYPVISIKKSRAREGTSFTLNVDCDDGKVKRHIAEAILSIMAREIALSSGSRNPVVIYSPHWSKIYPNGWRKGDKFRIVFKAYEKQLNHFDSTGLGVLIPKYLEMIGQLDNKTSFGDIVRRSVLKMSQPMLPDLKTAAYALNATSRTLQRRLGDEGLSYRQISDDLKRAISDLLLLHRSLDVADISAMLGYSEPAAYIHAFVKWHGRSPTEVKKRK